MSTFESRFEFVGHTALPKFAETRIMMMPVDLASGRLPDSLRHYQDTFNCLRGLAPCLEGIGYLTIDEKSVPSGQTHRRAGLHVDGIYRNGRGSWGGGWGAVGAGMLTVSSHAGCRAWRGTFDPWPGDEGDCDHLRHQLGHATFFAAGDVYWLDGLCVHESMPMPEDTERQFVRLSMPSDAPWFDGYTENPLGVQPTGPILARREFMG